MGFLGPPCVPQGCRGIQPASARGIARNAVRSHAARVAAGGKKTLDRMLSRAGICSRNEARAAIRAGRVHCNGRVVQDPDAWVDPVRDRLLFDGRAVQAVRKQVWMLHKPTGFVTTADDELDRTTVYALLPPDLPWLAPVGRLDRDTSGLLLFTNDSDLAHRITAPGSKLPKTYQVHCRGRLSDTALQQLAAGVPLHDGLTLPATVRRIDGDDRSTRIELVITEGRNRQVRRMLLAVGSRVYALHRSRIGPLSLGELPAGAARALTPAELQQLRAAVPALRNAAPRAPQVKPTAAPRRPRTNRGTAR